MGFLRRLFGGGESGEAGAADAGGVGPRSADADAAGAADTELSVDEAERAHELELARQEAARLDELQQRQLRFADYAWTPPAQGGEKRADDEDRPTDG